MLTDRRGRSGATDPRKLTAEAGKEKKDIFVLRLRRNRQQ